MIPVFVKEQVAYTESAVKNLFDDKFSSLCISKLKEYGILKTIRKSGSNEDLSNLEDFEIIIDDEDDVDFCYVFKFVGVIIVNGHVLYCIPKYYEDVDLNYSNAIDDLRQIIQVLEKYDSKEQIIKKYINDNCENSYNRLAAMVYFLTDYFENGIYNNTKKVIETNGNGEIDWNRTINNTFPIVYRNNPYYLELQTRKQSNDEYNLFKRLHKVILTMCSKELKEAGILDIFGFSEIELSSENLDDIADAEYIVSQLEKEMNVEFNTRKQSVLNNMKAFVNDEGRILDISSFSLFGTKSFNMVWQDVCSFVLNNKLDEDMSKNIDRPLWYPENGKENDSIMSKRTLTPDIISVYKNYFIIFDAKYYNYSLDSKNKKLKGNPGVYDVAKQYLYQLAFEKYRKKFDFIGVRNCFIMPTNEDKVLSYGFVKMQMFNELYLENILVRKVPAKQFFNMYLTNQKYDIGNLELL